MTITRINVRLPSAPIVDIMMLNSTFIVVQDCASFKTRNCRREEAQNKSLNNIKYDSADPHQTQAPQHTKSIDQLEYDIQQAGRDNQQIENVPTAQKELLRQGHQFNNALEGEYGRKNLRKRYYFIYYNRKT